MKTKNKKVICTVIIALFVMIAGALIYYSCFTDSGYTYMIPYNPSFEKIADNIYINKGNSKDKNEIIALIDQAKERDKAFFGDFQSEDDTIIIICDDKKISSRIGEKVTLSYAFPKKKSYVCISNEYFCLDIISHELTHAELRSRLNVKAMMSVPTWFDEGLATQNDYREQYSFETWIKDTDNGKNIVALDDMDSPSEFYSGTEEEKRFRYMNAKHEVSEWMEEHHQNGLIELIDKLNNNEDFYDAY